MFFKALFVFAGKNDILEAIDAEVIIRNISSFGQYTYRYVQCPYLPTFPLPLSL